MDCSDGSCRAAVWANVRGRCFRLSRFGLRERQNHCDNRAFAWSACDVEPTAHRLHALPDTEKSEAAVFRPGFQGDRVEPAPLILDLDGKLLVGDPPSMTRWRDRCRHVLRR